MQIGLAILPIFPNFSDSSGKDNREWRRFRGWISCSRRLVGDASQVLFLIQHGASCSEAATVKGSAKRQTPERCAAAVQGAEKHQPLPRRQLEASGRLAAELCQA